MPKQYTKSASVSKNNFDFTFKPRGPRQAAFLESINKNVVSFGIGSAGTGKTLLAVYCALKGLTENKYKKIILTRPTVSAGRQIGYLPGDERDKLEPFLIPLLDAIEQFLPNDIILENLIENGKIEIAATSFMRGRNFEDCFVIVDEAENLTKHEFYLLLTRICPNSKMVFTGDSVQADISNGWIEEVVAGFEGKEYFGSVKFLPEDCQRHPLVKTVMEVFGTL